tara:strand:+ start:1526 stop:2020 length:495 start_codon:yes stop_codon:yes gene_type:complete
MDNIMIAAIVLMAIISIMLVWINLPGTFVFLLLIFCFDFLLRTTFFPENFLMIMLIIFVVAEAIEFLLNAIMVKFYGGKNSSAFLSILGAIIGAIIGNLILPIIGAFLGLIIGAYLATYYNEKSLGENSEKASQIARSTTLSYMLAKSIKSLLILMLTFYLILN